MASEIKSDNKVSEDDAEQGDVQEDDDADEVEEAAEVLMTDMTLDDDMDKIRDPNPGQNWIYHIEAYPWHADDINERFIRLIKLASFANLSVRKKPICHESEDPERIDDKVMERQRKGSLHLYAESYQTARSILRHSTWNNMMSKELTFEITKRSVDSDSVVTARIDIDTGYMSKVKFRNKIKGSFEARTAKVSNLSGDVTRDILDMVFCRSYVVYDGSDAEAKRENKEVNPEQKLSEIPGFSGSLNVDCLTRGSCRSLVLALKSVSIMGTDLAIAANDSQTMIVPVEPLNVGFKPKEDEKAKTLEGVGMRSYSVQVASPGRGHEVRNNNTAVGRTGSLTRINTPVSHMVQSTRVHPVFSTSRPRGVGVSRGMMVSQQPACVPFNRSGQGMPVPMTGRQKMNEKIRRNHPNIVIGTPNQGVHPPSATSAGFRAPNIQSIGDSFKQEIASLQSELERSTQAIEAKIERLKEESSYYSGYNEEMQMYVEGDWDQSHGYEYELGHEEYFDDGLNDYYLQSYDVASHDSVGYELPFEQPIEPVIPSNRGTPRRGAGRGRGLVRVTGQRPATGYIGNNTTSARNPTQVRNVRGRGGGGVVGVNYQGSGATAGYW